MSEKVYSIHGRGLKLDTKEDIDPYVKELIAANQKSPIEEVHFGGTLLSIAHINVLSV
jgi:Ran GTPase-activating protein 1